MSEVNKMHRVTSCVPLPSANYLSHHGILGQKWGRKNGPPYPLSASDHSASEKKAGWRDSLNESKKAILKSVKKTHVKPQIVDDLYSSKMTKDKKKQTKSLYNKGYDTKEIAEKLNIPLEDVGGYLVEIGILE